ncbi:MAG: leucine-rich repeat domain-containing protein, partial [Clostridia bacterium]|nr:leucine-rich repeat domain-containing protein [Clostridia bacterium]
CTALKSIIIPKTIKIVEENAFNRCQNLSDIYYAGDRAQWEDVMKVNSKLPDSAMLHTDYVKETVIDGCVCVEGVMQRYIGEGGSVTIPKDVTGIGKRAFAGCDSITSILIPNYLTVIAEEAFAECPIKSVNIKGTVETIGRGAFKNCRSLVSFKTADLVATIESEAFLGCIGLSAFDVPKAVKRIGDYAFAGCVGLESVTIPKNVMSIGDGVFSDCSGLRDVYFEGIQQDWDKLNVDLPPKAVFRCEEKKYYVIDTNYKRKAIVASVFEPAARELLECVLKIEGENYSSYDNSDDERASSSSNQYGFVRYGRIDPFNDNDYIIWDGDRPRGVVFRVKSGRDTSYHRFYFDQSINETVRLGYSASHSSSYTYINNIKLVKKGEDGAPDEGGYINFNPSENYPDF